LAVLDGPCTACTLCIFKQLTSIGRLFIDIELGLKVSSILDQWSPKCVTCSTYVLIVRYVLLFYSCITNRLKIPFYLVLKVGDQKCGKDSPGKFIFTPGSTSWSSSPRSGRPIFKTAYLPGQQVGAALRCGFSQGCWLRESWFFSIWLFLWVAWTSSNNGDWVLNISRDRK
jgi:hypothetical protein